MQISLLALVVSVALAAPLQAQEVRRSVPIDPVTGILDAFRSHDIVALGEGSHGNEQGAAFRLALIRDPRFSAIVNDIVVEWGNSKYQDVMDRFVRGEEVATDVLRQVWQNTTQPHTLWDVPIYEEFFRAVRGVNTQLPHERQLRVVLGDPPIDWDTIHNPEDFQKWTSTPIAHRDRSPAAIMQREVLEKKRRALVIYGDLHLNRKAVRQRPDASDGSHNLVDLLEQAGAKVFSIHTATIRVDLSALQSDIAAWPKPSLSVLSGTVLGRTDFTAYYPARDLIGLDGKPLFPRPMEQQFDALLYLAPPSAITMSRMPPALCADASYMKMRVNRIMLLGMTRDIDRLHEQCKQATASSLALRLLADRADDWVTLEVPGIRVHVRRGSAADGDKRALADLVSATRRDVLARLDPAGIRSTMAPADVFFVESREDPHNHPLGVDGSRLERAWLAKLRDVRPAHPDVRCLMAEGC